MLLSSVADQFEVALQLEQDQARRDEVAAQQAALAAGQQRQQAARAVIQPILKELFIDDPPPNLFQPPPVARSNPSVLLVEKALLLHQEQQVPKETARKSSMGKSHAPKSSRKDSVGPSNCKRSKRDEEEDDVLKGDEDNCSEVIRLKHQLNILYQKNKKNKEERIAVEKAKMNLAKKYEVERHTAAFYRRMLRQAVPGKWQRKYKTYFILNFKKFYNFFLQVRRSRRLQHILRRGRQIPGSNVPKIGSNMVFLFLFSQKSRK